MHWGRGGTGARLQDGVTSELGLDEGVGLSPRGTKSKEH